MCPFRTDPEIILELSEIFPAVASNKLEPYFIFKIFGSKTFGPPRLTNFSERRI